MNDIPQSMYPIKNKPQEGGVRNRPASVRLDRFNRYIFCIEPARRSSLEWLDVCRCASDAVTESIFDGPLLMWRLRLVRAVAVPTCGDRFSLRA